jgi:hypothetical protein
MNHPRTTFKMHTPNGSLDFAIRLNTKENLRVVTVFYFKFCKRSCLKQTLGVRQKFVPYRISGHEIKRTTMRLFPVAQHSYQVTLKLVNRFKRSNWRRQTGR